MLVGRRGTDNKDIDTVVPAAPPDVHYLVAPRSSKQILQQVFPINEESEILCILYKALNRLG